MNSHLTLGNILQFEDTADVPGICCPDTGIPLWSTIRNAVLRMILGDMHYSVSLTRGDESPHFRSRLRQITAVSRSIAHNALTSRSLTASYPILLMATGARMGKRDTGYFNNLSGYFVEMDPGRSYAIEDLFDWNWPFPRHHKNVLFQSPLRVEGVLKGRVRARGYRKPIRALVDLVSRRAIDSIGWDVGTERRKWLENYGANAAASLLPRYQRYQRIFKKLGTQVLIKEEACYGGADNASAVSAARDEGIVTAEYQHGTVSSSHIAYNFSTEVSRSVPFQKTLPEYFLTYGSWWGEQINAPVKSVTIGNPHRTENIGIHSRVCSVRRRILVLGDGIETTVYLEFCKCLAVAIDNDADVVFRPHPLERAAVLSKYPEGSAGNVRIDSHKDIYSSFLDSDAVVSEVSTGLFEAIGLVPKVFIWNTSKARFSLPVHPFETIADAKELAHLFLDENSGQVSTQQVENIWAPNWQDNYRDFIKKVVQS